MVVDYSQPLGHHLYPLVDEITLKDRGDEIVPDAFDLIHAFWVGLIHAFWNREIAPHRVHADDLAARHCLLDLPGDTCDGTAGTRSDTSTSSDPRV